MGARLDKTCVILYKQLSPINVNTVYTEVRYCVTVARKKYISYVHHNNGEPAFY